MKPTSLFIISFILLSTSLFAQSIRVEYTEESKREFPPGTTQAAIDFMRLTKAVLIATPEQSWYETEKDSTMVVESDISSLSPEMADNRPNTNTTTRMNWNRKMVAEYKSFTAHVNTSYTKLHDIKLHVERSLQAYEWTITNETAIIAGMLCKKAIAPDQLNRPIEAWFTDDIPISNGPSVYHGLPGLILKVETAIHIVSATKVSFVEMSQIDRSQWNDSRLVEEEALTETFRQLNMEQKKQKLKSMAGPNN